MADKYSVKEHLETVYDKTILQDRINALQEIVDKRRRGGKIISEHKQTGRVHQWLLYYVK
ncbi:hypothetical protein SEA_DAUBENSKI_163 [Streptomyces phage Daubenski]|uniref:Uncharacterized protein n=1 Tax=Streptomyces phage Daubenski TaxID=2653725 RepID=A0A5Q2WF74_9CAUD|nr:hypothetical protein KNU80_gp130 [Streptomyces phage Daubenski]QGH76442.1 hypothetical protein SEA_DAUBENSKI_163 [Streptomyces phage Daubenski]